MSPGKESVRSMFEEIAPRYDFLNHFLSFGIDNNWRRRVVREIWKRFNERLTSLRILDVATGTGDLAIAVSKLHPARIDGIDISPSMMEVGQRKIDSKGLTDMILFREGEAERIPFEENNFDVVMVAFGVRNFEELKSGLKEMKRVMKPGGLMLILEFSHPDSFPLKSLYTFYSRMIIPLFGKLISKHHQAYTYLPETVAAFPGGETFLAILQEQGLQKLRQIRLSGGIATLYCAEK
ncbi:MAG: bifunctional demethylmenaquinone methyltransferase/2-methoxy-6-polyprenyl-1,4-benzoquinol methylase UbiE [Bacteroidales bacterium]|nr:bifunctional demethylmenaquinone methyltransferase/2-methoxy-6-polyprenyl-1,4-benzoquinol methylase UbiE [Bacteroidales bacterium]